MMVIGLTILDFVFFDFGAPFAARVDNRVTRFGAAVGCPLRRGRLVIAA